MIEIVYEDPDILVVNKPAGILVVPTPKGEKNTLTSVLARQINKEKHKCAVYPCHRLDRETSGLIIYAKNAPARQKMTDLFKKREVKKRYFAFVHGNPGKKRGSISMRIEGKEALTHYRVIEDRRGYSIVEVEPVTGRTNQIRIHFRKIGHPIVGERKFAFAKDYRLKFRRIALHAMYIAFRHPVTGTNISLKKDPPEDMKNFTKYPPP